VEQVTADMLGGATPPEVEAFRMAALQTVMDLEVSERTAILVLCGDGTDWRERVAELVPIGWGALTGELDLRPPGMRASRPPPPE
jgi:hypothetical protein